MKKLNLIIIFMIFANGSAFGGAMEFIEIRGIETRDGQTVVRYVQDCQRQPKAVLMKMDGAGTLRVGLLGEVIPFACLDLNAPVDFVIPSIDPSVAKNVLPLQPWTRPVLGQSTQVHELLHTGSKDASRVWQLIAPSRCMDGSEGFVFYPDGRSRHWSVALMNVSPRVAKPSPSTASCRSGVKNLRLNFIAGGDRNVLSRWYQDRRPTEIYDLKIKPVHAFEDLSSGAKLGFWTNCAERPVGVAVKGDQMGVAVARFLNVQCQRKKVLGTYHVAKASHFVPQLKSFAKLSDGGVGEWRLSAPSKIEQKQSTLRVEYLSSSRAKGDWLLYRYAHEQLFVGVLTSIQHRSSRGDVYRKSVAMTGVGSQTAQPYSKIFPFKLSGGLVD